jgi:hypothetical protein
MVVFAVGLAGSWRASGVRYGETERVRVLGEQPVIQGAFADA